MVSRRPLGSLESEVLEVLWKSDDPLTPSEVLHRLDTDLAYTTVMTVLGRLWGKGLANRSKTGRAFAYSAVMSEADLSADRMRKVLDASSVGSIGLHNQRVLLPALASGDESSEQRFRRTIAVESLLFVVVLLITSLLVIANPLS